MTENTIKKTDNGTATLFAIFATALLVVFIAFRSSDLLSLPKLVGNLGGGPLLGGGIVNSVTGIVIAGLVCAAWFSLGSVILRFVPEGTNSDSHLALSIARAMAVGAVAWSIVWFFLGLAGLYSMAFAIVSVVVGIGCVLAGSLRKGVISSEDERPFTIFDKVTAALISIPVLIAMIASLAPPTAKDTLLYHFAVPKAFIAQGSSAFIEGNIASYLALGAEMHVVCAMLLGGILSETAGEAAAGAVMFLFFPILLAAIYGWAREAGISRRWSLIAVLMAAAVPTAYHVSSSGYVDIALALFVTLAVHSLCVWWKTRSTGSLVYVAIFLGAALSIKLTTLFVIAAFALIILLKARTLGGAAGKAITTAFLALLFAGAIASPWYLRNWVATGSPVFPFYMSIWKGEAVGWDVERSNLFQGINSQYGAVDRFPQNYLTAPLRVSLAAQPEMPDLYDGVLGAMFIIGLPLLLWAFWKKKVAVEAKIAAGVVGIIFLFWLFSSQQLRYLLPIVPQLAIAIAVSAEALSGRRDPLNKAAKFSLVAASIVCILTSLAWFSMRAPLRVVLGGETRDEFLTRNLDHFSYYKLLGSESEPDDTVWLINMRRDTYNIDRPVFSDYLFEDWTLRQLVWESRNAAELKAKTATLGVQYVLARHDFLLDYDRSTLVDEKRPRAENEAKLAIARELILDQGRTVKADKKFSLVRVNDQ